MASAKTYIECMRGLYQKRFGLFPAGGGITDIGIDNNVSIMGRNAAGTADVPIIKVNASDQVEIATALSPSGGILPYGSAMPNRWVLDIAPVAAATGDSTKGVTGQQFVGAIWVPATMAFTGTAVLLGTVGGTDRVIVALYDANGALVANSTTVSGGTVAGTAATIQSIPFTATYTAKGPAKYFLSVQSNGTTAEFRTVPIGVGLTSKTNTSTSATPLASITVPTGFVADAAVIASLY